MDHLIICLVLYSKQFIQIQTEIESNITVQEFYTYHWNHFNRAVRYNRMEFVRYYVERNLIDPNTHIPMIYDHDQQGTENIFNYLIYQGFETQ